MDPQWTSDGRPFGPVRLEEIIEERYQISKRIHTSYLDVGDITPLERKYLMTFIKRDVDRENELRDKTIQSMNAR